MGRHWAAWYEDHTMKLLRTYAAYEVHDLEQEVIEITSDDCTHGDSFRIFCFVGHRKNGCTFEQEIMPGNVWEMAKELAKTEEEAAAFIARTEKAGHDLCWFNKTGCAITNGWRPAREKWHVINRGQKIRMAGRLFVFGVDAFNNPFLNAAN